MCILISEAYKAKSMENIDTPSPTSKLYNLKFYLNIQSSIDALTMAYFSYQTKIIYRRKHFCKQTKYWNSFLIVLVSVLETKIKLYNKTFF